MKLLVLLALVGCAQSSHQGDAELSPPPPNLGNCRAMTGPTMQNVWECTYPFNAIYVVTCYVTTAGIS